jgi:hypothetical protein
VFLILSFSFPFIFPPNHSLKKKKKKAIFCLACIMTTIFLRYFLARENAKLEELELRNVIQEEGEKADVEEIVDVDVPGGGLVLSSGFRYVL